MCPDPEESPPVVRDGPKFEVVARSDHSSPSHISEQPDATALPSATDQSTQRTVDMNDHGVYLLGSGSAFGYHYSTDEIVDAFRAARLADGDFECDFEFAERVFRACDFDSHSIALPPADLFRTMKV